MYFIVVAILGLTTLILITRKMVNDPRLVVGIRLLVLGPAWQLTSCLFVESGIYVTEQSRYGTLNGASLLFILFWIIFIVGFLLPFGHPSGASGYAVVGAGSANLKIRASHKEVINRKVNLCVFIFIIFVMVLLYSNLLLSPIPFFEPYISRFNYWENSRWPFLTKFLGTASTFVALAAGYTYSHAKELRIAKPISLLLLLSYILYLVLIGNKFGGLLVALVLFVTPILVMRPHIRIRLVNILGFLAAGAIVFGITYYSYSKNNPFIKTLGLSTLEAVGYRFAALQGHLWWGVVEDFLIRGERWTTQVSFASFIDGMKTLMRYFGSGDIEATIARGVNFTNGYPAILLFTFPLPFALTVHFIFAVITGFVARVFMQTLRGMQLFHALVVFQAFNWILYSMAMGSFIRFIRGIVIMAGVGMAVFVWKVTKMSAVRLKPGNDSVGLASCHGPNTAGGIVRSM